MTINILNIIYALGMGSIVGGVAGYVGSLMVTKRMALTGGALGHLALPGVALALRYDIDISCGAILFLGVGIILIWLLQQVTTLPTEALIAITFSSSLAVSFLFLPEQETHRALLGNVSSLTATIFTVTVLISLCIFIALKVLYKKIILMTFSPELAHVEGINTRMIELLYLFFIALVIALGVRIIGGLMTAALVAIPASSSKLVSADLKSYSLFSILFGAISCGIGIISSLTIFLPVGPLIVIASTFIFIICLAVQQIAKG